MSLRNRLIIAFLLLSVLPLSAVTAFWYISSVAAFERAAEREAAETAREIGRRMELVTSAVGRRMDRMFAVAADPADPDPERLRQRIALLGETASLVERLEFHPMEEAAKAPTTGGGPAGARNGAGVRPAPPAEPRVSTPVQPPPPPSPPEAPAPVVVDVRKALEEARTQARDAVKDTPPIPGVDLGAIIGSALAASAPAAEAGLAAFAEMMAREAERAAAASDAKAPEMVFRKHQVEVPVTKGGKVVGKANAVMNLDRTLVSVLALSRNEQGEIPFAIDPEGQLYTPDAAHRATLDGLAITANARAAASGGAVRVGDWIVVARQDPSGLLFGIARPVGETLREIQRMSWRNLAIGLGVIALAGIGIVPISHRMTQHVSSLSAGVRQLAGGDFKARVPVQSRDEFGALAAAFNSMAADLERHQALVVEQERLRRELELSRLIQTEMLPRAPLRLGAAEIKGVSIPAREVGGDFFNYFPLADGRLALLVGDVSGKGVSAALLMANVQATLRARLPLETDLAALAAVLDDEIDANTPRGVYLTLFLAILDVERGLLRYVNAGHNPQFLLRAAGDLSPLSSTGLPIALYPGQGYREAQIEVGRGDLLFFYTDGLVETENERGEMFGAERLQALLADVHANGIDKVLEDVERIVRTFRGAAEPFDDATMMALRVEDRV